MFRLKVLQMIQEMIQPTVGQIVHLMILVILVLAGQIVTILVAPVVVAPLMIQVETLAQVFLIVILP